MSQTDSSTLPQQKPLLQAHGPGCTEGITSVHDAQVPTVTSPVEDTQAYHDGQMGETTHAAPFFPVTEKVSFKSMPTAPERGAWHVSPKVAQLVSLVSLGALVLWPLSSCGTSDVPCPVPAANGKPAVSCTTSSGSHYLWMPNRGGWVPSDDGLHPNANAHGVGADDGHSGVGGGHDGSGHGGSEGG